MTADERRDWQAEHNADYARMGGLVAAFAISCFVLGCIALYFAIKL